ncbi:MAG: adenylate kinase [Sulfolobales archaeon]|nr:adenylate kinase [Sulfolobales archaeon]MCX8208886.1 adenylate kinase [Sulfolobales archaeon]MDW8011243.1 adenylate kinase [Sulfolobales archaeon]
MLKTVVVVGIPGVGKSTVLSIAVKILVEKGYTVKLVNFGDYMLSYLKKLGETDARDQIRRLRLATQLVAQEAAAKAIRRDLEALSGDRSVGIVDTHAVIRTSLGYWPGLPLAVLGELRPSVIVVIEASPEEVLERQRRDVSRYRKDLMSIEFVEELLQINRYYAIASSVISGAALRFIRNSEGLAERAAEELVKVVEEI